MISKIFYILVQSITIYLMVMANFRNGCYLLVFAVCLLSCKGAISRGINSSSVSGTDSIWAKADQIIEEIIVPQFKDQDFLITDYGAVADGKSNNSDAIKKAIAACVAAGGGMVIIPEGKFLTGPIHLKSNVNLHLKEGAEVLFSTNQADYLPVVHTSYEGVELMNYSPLIYAYEQKNIAVTGKGIFNGQADKTNWWPWSGAECYGHKDGSLQQKDEHNLPRLRKMNEEGTPVNERIFGEGHQLRPSILWNK